ncbi:MAG: hypothetical protein E3J86_14830 [Candidatus Thorarchaeota archaeon]|nr:MAG: hypothetical protein E3J86_14830 [Candidatus Thorarchaeota archaeon]
MSDDEIGSIIDDHIKKTSRLLPDSFETDDLLDDLRSHIRESFSDKVQKRPSEDPIHLIKDVLDDLGSPEEIARQYGIEQIEEPDTRNSADKWIYYTMRLMASILVVVLASWIASTITEGLVDFNFAVIMLLAFAIFEWYVRTQQTKDA